MKILIIEDEKPAAEKLEHLILRVEPGAEVLARPDSVRESVEWFNNHPPPDLAFMDIQLGDGLSFEIFEQAEVNCPVIFTTAYDEYALRAFKVNSIDYLLKPVGMDELKSALEKFRKVSGQKPDKSVFDQVLKSLSKEYKSRFLVKVGEHIRSLPVGQVQCFYSMDKSTFVLTAENRNYDLDYTLEQIESLIDPSMFFRISRKFIIKLEFIKDIISYTNSRLKVVLQGETEVELIVSREKVKDFKAWLDQ
ncbi:MAG: LytTR family DNA-binding domain-containing protein [Bacteroidales bacterium]|nr:LytTR family DNA-binding domain-containing protein [Bacteroidales bacterium]MCF8344874.1 LytTR family DNA-binding domain-containing protein [Bacteroidales bacterium]MCF8351752.1 LytTR family DNA-binding domain-containing protein [Bacteroidales bacterium]MCF8375150.1 LytTR family DNA-binding domain-containing protein [Bacteroidales bacterium]MCF8401851.1 LytTR family DNA-binding domain-containing protein [Bacteroidales bacterium]